MLMTVNCSWFSEVVFCGCTFALQLVHHGDVVQGDDGQHGLSSGQSETLFEDGGDIAGHQLLRQALMVGDEHDDDQQTVTH